MNFPTIYRRPAVRVVAMAMLAASLPAQNVKPRAKRILAIGQANGFQHGAVSTGMATMWKLGRETGLWDTYIRTGTQLITKKKLGGNAKKLDYFDAVFFYTSGELTLDESQKSDLLAFVMQDGKGFIASHSAIDTLYKWPEYGDMVGGYFDLHPWNQFQASVIVEDRGHPAARHFPPRFTILDEIYQVKAFSRANLRVLMRLDPDQTDLPNENVHRADKDFAVAWSANMARAACFTPRSAVATRFGNGLMFRRCGSKRRSGRWVSRRATPRRGRCADYFAFGTAGFTKSGLASPKM